MSERAYQRTLSQPEEHSGLSSVNWSFPDANTKYLTHGIHPYPARMIPQIPDHLLFYFKENGYISGGDWVFDPFAGSGTTGVEARRHGLNSILVDINPLACMVSRVKASPPSPERIRSAREALYGVEFSANPLKEGLIRVTSENSPFSVNLDSNYEWFPEPQLSQLGYLRERIDALNTRYGEDVVRCFRIALSETSRRVSYQRNNEFKRYRISEDERPNFDPDVWEIFRGIVDGNLSMIEEYHASVDMNLKTIIHNSNAQMPSEVDSNSADIIITSPPYGDHRTTVAYGQFSKDPAIISSQESANSMRQVDKYGLGGESECVSTPDRILDISDSLANTVDKLRDIDGRSEDALKFFLDYYETVKQTNRILKPGQPIALVVANRTISRVNIPTHRITKEFYHFLGFDVKHTLPRDIPKKTLPFENTPENVPGETGDLMAQEYILIMRAPDW